MRARALIAVVAVLFFAISSCFAGQTNLVDGIEPAEPYVNPTNWMGVWIWTNNIWDGQDCRLQRSFVIPSSCTVTNSRLLMTVDNEFVLYLDGHELGHGAEWRELYEFDVTRELTSGRHTLSVSGLNSFGPAGMLFGLRMWMADGQVVDIKSDSSWRIVPEEVDIRHCAETSRYWPAATVVGYVGVGPRWSTPQNINVIPRIVPVKVFFWQTGWFQISLGSICALVILLSLRLTAQLALDRKEQSLLREERARIARDIHDDIGARMTQLVLHGELAQGDLPADSKTRQKLDAICEEARGLLSTMDEVLWAVNPNRDTLRDFTSYVCNYAQTYLSTTSIQCLFEVDTDISATSFNLPLRRSLLLAIKETLNNAVKYSQATELHLKVHWLGEQLVVVVQDNGKGFDPTKVRPGRNGLSNMAQRMKDLGGSCVITSEPGKGCRIQFGIPLMHSRTRPMAWIGNAILFCEQISPTKNSHTNEPSQNHDPTRC